MMLKMVVLPDPFGPMIEKMVFFSTLKLTSFTAFRPPKEMLRCSTVK